MPRPIEYDGAGNLARPDVADARDEYKAARAHVRMASDALDSARARYYQARADYMQALQAHDASLNDLQQARADFITLSNRPR